MANVQASAATPSAADATIAPAVASSASDGGPVAASDGGAGAAGGALIVGVDLGATKIAVIVVDAEERVVGRARSVVPTASGRGDASPGDASLVDAVAATIRDALDGVPDGGPRLTAIGVGAPGRIDPERGTVRGAVNLGVDELALGPALGDRFGVPWALENDVRAAALGVARADPSGGDLAYVNIGTGVAAGIVLDGEVRRGARGIAGEVGHIAVTEGPHCRCGLDGCVETQVAGPAIVARARAAGLDDRLSPDGDLRATDVLRAAAAGDASAATIADAVGRTLAGVAHGLILTYDVPRVVFGGGVTEAGDAFLAPILRDLERRREASPFLRDLLAPGSVGAVEPGSDAACRGAVAIARARLAAGPAAGTVAG